MFSLCSGFSLERLSIYYGMNSDVTLTDISDLSRFSSIKCCIRVIYKPTW